MSGAAGLDVTTHGFPAFRENGLRGGSVDTGSDLEATTLAAQIVPVFFLLAGIVGNVVTVVALYKREELSAGCRVYHTALCLLDVGALLFSILRFWVLALVQVDLHAAFPFFCKFLPWLEYSVLMASAWVLVAMIMQVQEGLRKTYSPGVNITRWKSLVYTASAVFISLIFNSVRIFMFSLQKQRTHDSFSSSPDNRLFTNDSSPTPSAKNTNGTSSEHLCSSSSSNSDGGCSDYCAPTPGSISFFVNNVWPWFSLYASLLVPIIVISVGIVFVARCYWLNCRYSGPAPSSPAHFVTLTASSVVLTSFSLVTSFVLCGLCLWHPRLFWSDYGDMFRPGSAEVKGYGAACVFRLVFYVPFALRWLVVCCTCRLWAIVLGMCRRKKSQ